MGKVVFKVQARQELGKGKQLRKQGIIPANIHGAGKKSQAVKAELVKFDKLYDQVGDTGLIYLQLDDQTKQIPVLVDDVQLSPVKDETIHVVFKEVDLKDKIKAEVPVELVGEFELVDAVLVTVRDSIEVEALPTDLPEKFEINVESLTEIGQSVTLNDLSYDRVKVEIMAGEEGMDAPVLLVQEVKEEVEPEPVEVEGDAEGEAVEGEEGEGTAEGGEGEAKEGVTKEGEEKKDAAKGADAQAASKDGGEAKKGKGGEKK